jgi:hypothetical protein
VKRRRRTPQESEIMTADNRRVSAVAERRVRTVLGAFALLVAGAGATAAELPQDSDRVHEGVATCASSVCHGSATERGGTNVLQNEFVTWTRYDKHSGAWDLLKNEESRRMARKLGLENAHEADLCLDCHADNVPEERRGEEFQISDGVGCEACHGGSGDWLASHTADGNRHEDNLEAGLYPSGNIEARAQLCLSCHLGTEDKFATHRIMGAGHPRLAFELSTFSALMPPHWAFDEDHARRKGPSDEFAAWTGGLLTAAQQTLSHIGGPLMHDAGVFPEIALFDCHSCHHPMSDIRWETTSATVGLEPGVVRLNDANFVILLPIAEVLSPALQERLLGRIRALNRSVMRGSEALDRAATELAETVDELERALADAGTDAGVRRRILDSIIDRATRGDYRDYVAAEQAAMAMDLLLITLDRWEANSERVDELFASVADDEAYRPDRFATAAAKLGRAL